jgi:hypothetical protein
VDTIKKVVELEPEEADLVVDLLNRHASRLQEHYESSRQETKFRLLDKIKTIQEIIRKITNV